MQRCLPGRECVFIKPNLNRIQRRMRWAKTAFPVTAAALVPQSPTHNHTKSTHRGSQCEERPQGAKPVDTPAKLRKRLTPMHQQRKIAREAKSLALQGIFRICHGSYKVSERITSALKSALLLSQSNEMYRYLMPTYVASAQMHLNPLYVAQP